MALMMASLYSKEEHIAAGGKEDEAPKDAVLVHGILSDFGFHPRVKDTEAEIVGMLAELDPRFMMDGPDAGGGWSFLNLCMRADGSQWGEHRDCQSLLVLASATGHAQIMLPKALWSACPGGMPYVAFSFAPLTTALEA
jgi:hypothetical protein